MQFISSIFVTNTKDKKQASQVDVLSVLVISETKLFKPIDALIFDISKHP